MINTMQLKGTFNEGKGICKQKIASLLDNQILFEEGKKDILLGKLQVKFAKAKNDPKNYHSLTVLERLKSSIDKLPSLESIVSNEHLLLRERFTSTSSTEKA